MDVNDSNSLTSYYLDNTIYRAQQHAQQQAQQQEHAHHQAQAQEHGLPFDPNGQNLEIQKQKQAKEHRQKLVELVKSLGLDPDLPVTKTVTNPDGSSSVILNKEGSAGLGTDYAKTLDTHQGIPVDYRSAVIELRELKRKEEVNEMEKKIANMIILLAEVELTFTMKRRMKISRRMKAV